MLPLTTTPSRAICMAVLLCMVMASISCNDKNSTVTVSETRTVSAPSPVPEKHVAASCPDHPAEQPALPPDHPVIPPEQPALPPDHPVIPTEQPALPPDHPALPTDLSALPTGQPPTPSKPLTWETPPGWKEVEATSMRMANFTIAEDSAAECYVVSLRGTAGGVEANVNRWRSQTGLEAMSSSEIVALPTVTIMGKPSPFVEIAGVFTGMSDTPKSEHMLLGAIAEMEGRTLFVKMTGPAATVQNEKERFQAFCASLAEAQ